MADGSIAKQWERKGIWTNPVVREKTPADESPEGVPPTHRQRKGPDFANSSRFHSAPFQPGPVNHSTGPRFHPAPLHRLKPSKTGCPGALSAEAFAKSHQPASRASGPCRNFRPHDAPNIRPTSAAPGKPLALRLPAARQATALVSPGPSEVGRTRPRAPLMATTLTSSAPGMAQGVRYRNLRTTPVCCQSPPR